MTAAAVTIYPLSPQVLEKNAVEMLERDRWSREKLEEFQDRRLRRLLEHAVERSPYYREALGEDAVEASLGDLPTLPKSLLMDQFDRVVTDPRLRRRDLEGFLGAADAGELYHDEYRIFSTSGTSGLSGLFAYSQSEFAHWVAVFLRSLVRLGATAETRVVSIGAPSPLHLSRQVSRSSPGGAFGSAPTGGHHAHAGDGSPP